MIHLIIDTETLCRNWYGL